MLRCLAVAVLFCCACCTASVASAAASTAAGAAGTADSAGAAGAEDLEFQAPAGADDPATAAAMRSLAIRALPVYANPDRAQFLTNLSALQMVAGEYSAAYATRRMLGDERRREKTARQVDESLIYTLYAHARSLGAGKGQVPFDQAFTQLFGALLAPLDDRDAYTVAEWFATPLSVFRGNFQSDLDRLRDKKRISLAEAVDLTWSFLSFEAFKSFGSLVGPLAAQDEARRYVITRGIVVQGPGHTRLTAVLIRPRTPQPVPALLRFMRHADPDDDALDCAAHGYAGVVAYAQPAAHRASARKADTAGPDARTMIDWIVKQPWSDGRVGLYGSGYSAFAAWAAASRPLPALRALAVSSVAPPPGEGPRYPDTHAAAARRGAASAARAGPARRSVRVLTTTGYYDRDQAASLAFALRRARAEPGEDRTLLIGPYDDEAMQRGPLAVLAGYSVDPAAMIGLGDLRFEWFDHALKGAPAPALLASRVNFEVMGANAWRHADSVAGMSNGTVRLYLHGTLADGHYALTGHESPREPPASGTIESAAQDTADDLMDIVTRTLAPRDGVMFVSGVLHRPLEVSGRISGTLSYDVENAPGPSGGKAAARRKRAQARRAARRDGFELALSLYELRADGEYFQLFAPPLERCTGAGCPERQARGRAAAAARPAARTRTRTDSSELRFESERLTSVELHPGSRIVLVLEARRRGPRAAAAGPLPAEVKWLGGSFIELPIWRPASAPAPNSPPAPDNSSRGGASSSSPAPAKPINRSAQRPSAQHPPGKNAPEQHPPKQNAPGQHPPEQSPPSGAQPRTK